MSRIRVIHLLRVNAGIKGPRGLQIGVAFGPIIAGFEEVAAVEPAAGRRISILVLFRSGAQQRNEK